MTEGSSLPKSSVDTLESIICSCCEDLLPQNGNANPAKQIAAQARSNGGLQSSKNSNPNAFLDFGISSKVSTADFAGLQNAAQDLLRALLACLPAHHISNSLRSLIDRTAILIQHKEAMIASVLNPPPNKGSGKAAASILPFLAQLFPGDHSVESLVRPRMPVIRTGVGEGDFSSYFDFRSRGVG